MRSNHTRYRARYASCHMPFSAEAWYHVAQAIEVHVAASLAGGFFAVIERIEFAIFGAQYHQTTSTNISRTGIYHGDGKLYGNGRIHGITSLFQNIQPNL